MDEKWARPARFVDTEEWAMVTGYGARHAYQRAFAEAKQQVHRAYVESSREGLDRLGLYHRVLERLEELEVEVSEDEDC